MKRNIYINLVLLLFINAIQAQLISDYEDRLVPNNIHGQLDFSNAPLLSPDRFTFNQGFSMSMASHGSYATSIASYSNSITYWANNNLKINANFLLYSPMNMIGSEYNNGPQLALDAGITYKPTKNSYIQLNFQKLPKNGLLNGLNGNSLNNSYFNRRLFQPY